MTNMKNFKLYLYLLACNNKKERALNHYISCVLSPLFTERPSKGAYKNFLELSIFLLLYISVLKVYKPLIE